MTRRFVANLQKSAFGAYLLVAGLAASAASAHAGNGIAPTPEPSSLTVFAVAGTTLGAVVLFARLRKRAADATK